MYGEMLVLKCNVHMHWDASVIHIQGGMLVLQCVVRSQWDVGQKCDSHLFICAKTVQPTSKYTQV